MGKVAGLIGNAYTDHHYLSIDQELKPVLAWFNMHIVPGSVYVRADQMKSGEITDERVRDHLRQLGEAVIRTVPQLEGQSPKAPRHWSLWPRKKSLNSPRL